MSAEIQYGKIRQWPGKLRSRGERIAAPFKSGHTETLRLLEREFRLIGAEAPVVALAMDHFNRDGRPYSGAIPEHPGVLVSFVKPIRNAIGQTTVRVPLRFAADRFLTWETNVRAVAIGLEDLRRIDRYGITQGSEQYLGFKALPPPGPDHPNILTVEDAARAIESFDMSAGSPHRAVIVNNPLIYREAYRRAAAKLHPDATGGAASEDWSKLQAAKVILDAHHEGKL